MPALAKRLKIALLQIKPHVDKHENLRKVSSLVTEAVAKHKDLDLLILPECFTFPYSIKLFKKYAENVPSGETVQFLSGLSRKHGVSIIGGSISERGDNEGEIFNTSTVFSKEGELIAKHRKVHLFDVDIPDGISFQESRFLQPGNKATVFSLGGAGNVGLGVCYDLRFPELAMIAARPPFNSFLMCYPSAFNTYTGPLHWELLARARALDNQMYVALCSPAFDKEAKYHAYGHSLVVDPMGKVIAEAGTGEEIVYAELDPELLEKSRRSLPVREQRRYDIYKNVTEDANVSAK